MSRGDPGVSRLEAGHQLRLIAEGHCFQRREHRDRDRQPGRLDARGRCPSFGTRCAGIFAQSPAVAWGRQRMPISLSLA